MNFFYRFSWIPRLLLLGLAVSPLGGCLLRSRIVERQVSTSPLKTASQQELVDYIDAQAAKVHSLQATVDIDTSVGGEKRGTVTDYQEIRGYVLIRKPAMLRMIGLLPVVRTRAFDMVSDGKEFKLWIPPKNRFVEGFNDVQTPNPKQPLENVRPQHIYDALLLHSIRSDEIAVMENDTEIIKDSKGHSVQQADYALDVIRKGQRGWYLSRKIVFSRTDLLPHRQLAYDDDGNLATNSLYEDYKDYDGVNFPSQIQIRRPKEEYDITIHIVKLELNAPLTDQQFDLEQPPGADVVYLDKGDGTTAAQGPPGGAGSHFR
jgi:outer membrane lipoprotein-sorting protein